MIGVDVFFLISIIITAVSIVFLTAFFIEKYPSNDEMLGFKDKKIWECKVCTYVYFTKLEVKFSRCPVCKSLNKQE